MATKPKNDTQDTVARQLLKQLCQALDDKKAEDIIVLDVSKQSSITNYLVLATGTSDPHLRALRGELHRVIKETHTKVLGVDSGDGSGWTVVDAFDVMVHVLTTENRRRYRLETLWGDAESVNWKRIAAAPAPAAANAGVVLKEKPAAKKKAAPKKKVAVAKKSAPKKKAAVKKKTVAQKQ
jgi:ribosome-associated protein